jgi:hypothetical protein
MNSGNSTENCYFYPMPAPHSLSKHHKTFPFLAGVLFLFCYWLLAFDGITFSDDVYYLLAGRRFWEGSMEVDSYHFSTRWGAYIPSGLMGVIVGFDAHRISLISLLAYIATLAMLLKILPKESNPWILVLWFSTQVYFLHFLTKVYPDSLLVFWTALVPFSAVYRKEKPFLAALGIVSGLFFGFLTKETMVFLGPFPLLLWIWDYREKSIPTSFYRFLLGISLVFGCAYLGYFWVNFGHPLYRFQSIQEGHYISEFTYADKSGWVMLKRLTILPIVSFVERSYWLWLVMAIPAVFKIRRNRNSPGIEFGLALLSLMVCFWLMSTNFKFYNPIYLNPRHLIILIPVSSFLICYGWEQWQNHGRLKFWILALIGVGVAISLIQQDWKMVGFQLVFASLIYPKVFPYRNLAMGILLIAPSLAAPIYHQKTKNYTLLVRTLQEELGEVDGPKLILTHSFIHVSKPIIFPEEPEKQARIVPFEKLDSLQNLNPEGFKTLVYRYYEKAYPDEQVDMDRIDPWIQKNYELEKEYIDGLIEVRTFKKK